MKAQTKTSLEQFKRHRQTQEKKRKKKKKSTTNTYDASVRAAGPCLPACLPALLTDSLNEDTPGTTSLSRIHSRRTRPSPTRSYKYVTICETPPLPPHVPAFSLAFSLAGHISPSNGVESLKKDALTDSPFRSRPGSPPSRAAGMYRTGQTSRWKVGEG